MSNFFKIIQLWSINDLIIKYVTVYKISRRLMKRNVWKYSSSVKVKVTKMSTFKLLRKVILVGTCAPYPWTSALADAICLQLWRCWSVLRCVAAHSRFLRRCRSATARSYSHIYKERAFDVCSQFITSVFLAEKMGKVNRNLCKNIL